MTLSLVQKNDVVEVLGDVKVPDKFYFRIDLGVTSLNELFGGQDFPGILPGATCLFTGVPGAGKSTMALQLADLVQNTGKWSVLYNIGEENRNMVKIRADRIGLKARFCISQFEDVDELIDYCCSNAVDILFQDSLQSLRDGDLQGDRKLKSIAKKLQVFSKDLDATLFIIGHSTKAGTFAGPQEIKHDLDSHAHLEIDKESGARSLSMHKNRFGPALIPYEFSLSAGGLDFSQSTELKVESEIDKSTSKSADRRQYVVQFVKDKLLAGDKISGYCFERYNIDCSGGYWRGMVAKACKELQSAGKTVLDTRIDGRLHNYVKE